MVQPRGEHPAAAQLAPVLVRIDVVRVVVARAVVFEPAHVRAPDQPLRGDPDVSVRQPRGVLEHLVEVVAHEGTTAVRVLDRGVRGDLERRGIDLREIHVDGVIAERVVERRADDFGARRHLGMIRRIDLELVDRLGRIRIDRWRGSRDEIRGSFRGRWSTPCRSRTSRSGPRTSSAAASRATPMRFVNQLESGTSSSVFTFVARTFDRSPGAPNEFSRKS